MGITRKYDLLIVALLTVFCLITVSLMSTGRYRAKLQQQVHLSNPKRHSNLQDVVEYRIYSARPRLNDTRGTT